jgi:hypothetical protein
MPRGLTLTSPALGSTHPRTAPLAVTSAQASPLLEIRLQGGAQDLECLLPFTSGASSIPSGALSLLAAGTYAMTAATIDRRALAPLGWMIFVAAGCLAHDPAGRVFQGTLTLN